MGAVYLAISHCTENDITAADIFDDGGTLLLARDTSLNKYIIKRLADKGIKYIRIYDEETGCISKTNSVLAELEKGYKASVLSIKQIINNISCGAKLDYSKAVEVSELIYESIGGLI